MTPGPLIQDFKTEELRSFLEKGFGWRLASLDRLPGRTWSLNFRAERESDGFVFLVKCAPSGRGALADLRWRALIRHAEELSGAKAARRLFRDGPSAFGKCNLLYLTWCAGVRRFPDQLSPREFDAFVDDYLDLSRALQQATQVLPPGDLPRLRTSVLMALRGNRTVSWLGRILERDIPTEDVTYRQELVRVTHGDLHHGNVHFEKGRVSGFFDLEELRNGYPAQDIVRYVICAEEHLRVLSFRRRRRTLLRFEQAVLRLPYSRHEWTLAIGAYFLWKAHGRIRNGRIGFFAALNLRYRYAFYRRLRRIAAAHARPSAVSAAMTACNRGKCVAEAQACRRWFVAAGCVVLAGLFVLIRWALGQPLDKNAKSAARPSEYEIASGMSVLYRHLHAESASFKSCGIRRRRMGAFVLGAYRVLELEDVRLNLPLPAETGAAMPLAEKPADGAGDASAPRKWELDRVLEKVGLSGVGRFSGVKIRGLRVGRITETGAEPLFTAKRAETKGSSLRLSQCEVFRNGEREPVPDARLEWKDGLRLVWSGGGLDLPELLEDRR